MDELEQIVDNGGGERRQEDSVYGFCAHLADAVPRADDAFRQRLEARLAARIRSGTADAEGQEATATHASRWHPRLGRLLPQVLVPTTRLGWASLILALLLTFSAVVYAAVPAVGRLFQQEPGLQHVEQADLVQELDLSQTVNGVTVTLERAYADANRIAVGYSVKDPDGQRYHTDRLTVTDADDTVFPGTTGLGAAGKSAIFGIELPPGEEADVLCFDAAAVEGTPAELDLRLVVEVRELVLPTDTEGPSPTPAGSPAKPGEPMVELEPMPQGAVVGTFTFDFNVPFIPGRVAAVNQTVEAAGVAVRLERVVITPSETRVTLRFDPPADVETSWTSIVTLKAPGDVRSRSRFYAVADDSPVHTYGFLAPLYDRRGEWTLTVNELVGTELVPPYNDVRLAGPWVFRFRVP
ncbi:MAG: DUF4179 domain-containing protein [Spirochaetia bacterium]